MSEWILRCVLASTAYYCLASEAMAAPINGNSLAVKSSTGSASGSDWTINRDGYVGTYINVPVAGDVTVDVTAAGAASGDIDPHMNIVLADAKYGIDVAGGFDTYSHTFKLPAGTYFLRTEFNNDLANTSRSLTIRNLDVTGASFLNASTHDNAMAAADDYIKNFRKGDVKIGLTGIAPGTPVDVKMKRIGFNFGTAVPGSSYDDGFPNDQFPSVVDYFGTTPTTKRTNYQQRLAQNFNAMVPENSGKWTNNESTRDSPTVTNIDAIMDFAENPAHLMNVRMHNLIWGDNSNNGQQPNWVLNNSAAPNNGLLDKAALGDVTAKNDLRAEISERIAYYVGDGDPDGNGVDGSGANDFVDQAKRYKEIDVYNESIHTGSSPGGFTHNYWTAYGASGIAGIYKEAKDAVALAQANTKLFVNEYGVLGDSSQYFQHIETLQQAAVTAGYGQIVDGIGTQYYLSSLGEHNAASVEASLQNFAVLGLPHALTEFGITSSSISQSDAATIVSEMVRLTFGNPDSTGFFMWGFHQESGTGATTLFAPGGAFFTVNTSDFNTWTITEAGKKWQDLLGIQDWDGHPENGWWTAPFTGNVDQNGQLDFNGYFGDYELTINGHKYNVTLNKGTGQYALIIAAGDYNGDGTVNANDYTVWRDTLGSTTDLRADGNGDFVINDADYNIWMSNFGASFGSGGGGGAAGEVPEPATVVLMLLGCAAIAAMRPKPCAAR